MREEEGEEEKKIGMVVAGCASVGIDSESLISKKFSYGTGLIT